MNTMKLHHSLHCLSIKIGFENKKFFPAYLLHPFFEDIQIALGDAYVAEVSEGDQQDRRQIGRQW